MSNHECEGRVLELIEREAVDADGVRQALEACPECRAAFERVKATLALAGKMPIEEPPAEIDEGLFRAAAARTAAAAPTRSRGLHAPPWAVAAVALLAVGVGVWAIPRAVPPEVAHTERTEPADTPRATRATPAEPSLDEELSAPASNGTTAPKPVRANKRSAPAAPRSHRAPVVSVASLDGARIQEKDAIAACKQKVAGIEQRERARRGPILEPEEALAVGECFVKLGEIARARQWLRRAAAHPETRARAERALRALPSD